MHLYFMSPPAFHILFDEECKEMGYLAFSELRKWKIPDLGTDTVCMVLPAPVAVLL